MPEGPLVTASGEQLKVVGTTDILFSLKGLQISHNFVVIRDLYPALILGTDFLQANNASICYSDNTVRFYDELTVVPLQRFTKAYSCATVCKTTCIPCYTEAIIPVKMSCTFGGSEIILEPLRTAIDVVAVAGSLSKVEKGFALIRILNYKPHSITLNRVLS